MRLSKFSKNIREVCSRSIVNFSFFVICMDTLLLTKLAPFQISNTLTKNLVVWHCVWFICSSYFNFKVVMHAKIKSNSQFQRFVVLDGQMTPSTHKSEKVFRSINRSMCKNPFTKKSRYKPYFNYIKFMGNIFFFCGLEDEISDHICLLKRYFLYQ